MIKIKTTKRSFISSKQGVTIAAGEQVTVSFDVKRKSTGEDHPSFFRITTSDKRTIVSRSFKGIGIAVPSVAKLERFGSIAKSVFGNQVEPDGWDSEGSPSWLLVLGLI